MYVEAASTGSMSANRKLLLRSNDRASKKKLPSIRLGLFAAAR